MKPSYLFSPKMLKKLSRTERFELQQNSIYKHTCIKSTRSSDPRLIASFIEFNPVQLASLNFLQRITCVSSKRKTQFSVRLIVQMSRGQLSRPNIRCTRILQLDRKSKVNERLVKRSIRSSSFDSLSLPVFVISLFSNNRIPFPTIIHSRPRVIRVIREIRMKSFIPSQRVLPRITSSFNLHASTIDNFVFHPVCGHYVRSMFVDEY